MIKTKSILITGATGFVGSNLARHFNKLGYDIHIIVRKSSDLSILDITIDSKKIHFCDENIVNLKEIIRKVSPSHVFHIASLFLAQHSDKNINDLLTSNIVFSTKLVEAMVSEGVFNLINVGTSWQHYNDSNYNPVNLYAATKQAFETILEYYIETSNLKVITLSLYDTYGPRDTRKKLLQLLWEASKNQEPLLMSPGNQKINLVFIEDVNTAFEKAYDHISSLSSGHVKFGVKSSENISLKNLVNIFEKTLSVNLDVIWGGREYRHREVMIPWASAKTIPGWKTKFSIEEGLKTTFKSI